MSQRIHTPMKALIVALAAAGALTACGRDDDGQTVGQNVDEGIAQTQAAANEAGDKMAAQADQVQAAAENAGDKIDQKTDEMQAAAEQKGEQMQQEGAEMRAEAADKADEAKAAVANAVDSTKEAITDATITASVNTELAADKELSALKIDVDTDKGNVELSGEAPTASAKERATTIAKSVDGVISVDNQLKVTGS